MSFEVVRSEVIDENQNVPADSQDLRLEMKVKNNVLWHAINSQFKSVNALCKTHKELRCQATLIGSLLRFKVYPFKMKYVPGRKRELYCSNEYRHVCLVLEKVLRVPAEDLFPRHLYNRFVGVKTEESMVVNSFTALPTAAKKEVRALPAPAKENPEVVLDRIFLRERMAMILETLAPKERAVIRLRYGLEDGNSYTLEETAKIFKVTRSRIRQIEGKAIRKLQQPSRSQELAPFL